MNKSLHAIVAMKHCGKHTWRDIGNVLGWTKTKTRAKYLHRDKDKYPLDIMPVPCPICHSGKKIDTTFEEKGNYAKLTVIGERVRSIDEFLDAYNIDRTVWKVLRPKNG